MARLSRDDRDRVRRWLYRNDTVLWSLGVSRRHVCAHLRKKGIAINERQLRTLVAVAPCVRWVGRRRHPALGTVSLSQMQWERVDRGVRIEAGALPGHLLNAYTLARALGDNHAIHVRPEAVSASVAYRALVKAGTAPDGYKQCYVEELPE